MSPQLATMALLAAQIPVAALIVAADRIGRRNRTECQQYFDTSLSTITTVPVIRDRPVASRRLCDGGTPVTTIRERITREAVQAFSAVAARD